MMIWRAFAAVGCAYWILQAYFSSKLFRGLPSVGEMRLDESREDWPPVSVVITACDEEKAIEKAVRLRMEEDYPALEIIVVDDRSSDRTGEIVDKLAAEDPRIRVVHVTDLPQGWLGKIHAMNMGTAEAGGEWLLFSDADVQVKKGTIRRTITYAEEHGLDHLPVLPEFLPSNVLLDAGLSTLFRAFCLLGRLWETSDPRSNSSAGSGSYNLVRRDALEAAGGLEWLKLEVADDVALGQALKASGARQELAMGHGHVAVLFYPTIRDAMIGSERAFFTALGGCSFIRTVALGLVFGGLELSPLILAAGAKDR